MSVFQIERQIYDTGNYNIFESRMHFGIGGRQLLRNGSLEWRWLVYERRYIVIRWDRRDDGIK